VDIDTGPVDPGEAERAIAALRDLIRLRPRLLGQYNRIVVAARAAGWRPLHPWVVMDPDQATPWAVPLVAPRPVAAGATDAALELGRLPGRPATRPAQQLEDSSVVVPCRIEMAGIPQDEITGLLRRLAGESTRPGSAASTPG
jgi:hypothetical protein